MSEPPSCRQSRYAPRQLDSGRVSSRHVPLSLGSIARTPSRSQGCSPSRSRCSPCGVARPFELDSGRRPRCPR
jgi:hypothetical protein